MASECEFQLEKEFTPSIWSNRFSNRHEVLKHHIEHAKRVSKDVISALQTHLDIPYGDTDMEKLDVLGTDLPNDAPILVFIHGGFWQELSRQQSRYLAKPLYNMGIKTLVVGYTLCPESTLLGITIQIEKAAKYIFNYADEMKSKGIYFVGHSAGAHLIAKLLSNTTFFSSLSNPELLQAAILVSGVYDLTSLINTSVNKCLGLTTHDAKMLSPHFENYFHLRKYNLRLYILAGENDSYTFRKQSRDFYDLLMENCRVENINFEIKDNMDHFDIMEKITDDDNYLKRILIKDISQHLK